MRLTDALRLLKKLEWAGYCQGPGSGYMDSGGDGDHFPACPICGQVKPTKGARIVFMNSAIGHKKSCELKRALEGIAVTGGGR